MQILLTVTLLINTMALAAQKADPLLPNCSKLISPTVPYQGIRVLEHTANESNFELIKFYLIILVTGYENDY